MIIPWEKLILKREVVILMTDNYTGPMTTYSDDGAMLDDLTPEDRLRQPCPDCSILLGETRDPECEYTAHVLTLDPADLPITVQDEQEYVIYVLPQVTSPEDPTVGQDDDAQDRMVEDAENGWDVSDYCAWTDRYM